MKSSCNLKHFFVFQKEIEMPSKVETESKEDSSVYANGSSDDNIRRRKVAINSS